MALDMQTERAQAESGALEEGFPDWGATAPRGGKAVLNRMLREGTKVPLFLGQTFINSLRDVGYNDTTSAICEHIDNAIQWGATEVRVYFNETGTKGSYEIDVAVVDNGKGMAPHVLQVSMSFGGSMVYQNRAGIGRYGVGTKAAALSMGPTLEVYSWQERGAFYCMTLDVEEIGANRSNLVELPDPQIRDALPSHLARILSTPMVYPKNRNELLLLAEDEDDLAEQLGGSGTVVFVPQCDRLSSKKARTLVDHAVKDFARVHRKQIGAGLKLYVNNRLVEAFDPTFFMMNARHRNLEGLTTKRSELVQSWPNVQIPVEEGSEQTAPASIRLFKLPIEDWYHLSRKMKTNDLQLFEDHAVSFMRNDREIHIGAVTALTGKRHSDSTWMRLQIDFTGDLDEAFGVAMNKQGVRPKKYALDIIKGHIQDDVQRLKDLTARFRAEHSRRGSASKLTDAERRASDADSLQGRPLPLPPAPETEEEKRLLAENLRSLAITLKRDDETDEQAYERITQAKYITQFKHDEYWPFYHVDFRFGKVILTINTAHPFFTELYQPLSDLSGVPNSEDDDVGDQSIDAPTRTMAGDLLVGLQMLLFSLARTQSQMTATDGSDHVREVFETIRREWSANFKTQLHAR